MKLINLSRKWSKANSLKDNNPYQISFVYTINNDSFVIKGGHREIEEYINKFIKKPALHFITWWYQGKCRKIIRLINLPESYKGYVGSRNINYTEPHPFKLRKYICIIDGINNKQIFKKWYRRIPRKFPEEIKQILVR